MQDTLNIPTICKEFAEEAMTECNDSEERSEYLWQSIDGCSHVIYYHEAWNLVKEARLYGSYYDEGHDMFEEIGGHVEGTTIDDDMTKLAFCIIYCGAMNELSELESE